MANGRTGPTLDGRTIPTRPDRLRVLCEALDDTHPYVGDGVRDSDGQDRCAHPGCGLPEVNSIHAGGGA